jgi:hypothetical protein
MYMHEYNKWVQIYAFRSIRLESDKVRSKIQVLCPYATISHIPVHELKKSDAESTGEYEGRLTRDKHA